jgi:outer membrane receptor protein involved in Fe transport
MRIMNAKYIALAFLVLIRISAIAQTPSSEKRSAPISGIVSGQILDSISRTPVEYASVTLFPEGGKKAINGAVTNALGQFSIPVKISGYFKILVECVGYQANTLSHVQADKKGVIPEPAMIFLSKKETDLQAVTVVAPRNPVENKIDKMVFNAEKDISSQGGVATDILKKVPMVSVDVDGNVELAGSTSIRFLINGKPSTAFGSNIADVLQSIPASQIKNIEVITNPGAKYDAEGLGGIINIVLKESTVRGINGNISLAASTLSENGSFNLNARKGNFGVHAFVSGNNRLQSGTTSHSNRLTQDTLAKTNDVLNQDGNSVFKRHGMQTGMGFDWSYHKKNNFSGSFNYNEFGNSSHGDVLQSQTQLDAGGNAMDQTLSFNQTHNLFHLNNTDMGLNYKRLFDKEDQVLEISLRTSDASSTVNSNNDQFMMPQDLLYFGTHSASEVKEKTTEFKLDYDQPLGKKVNLGVGGKLSFRNVNSRSNVLSLDPATGDYPYDSSLSNHLTYHQKVYALYSEVSMPVLGLFDMKIGARYERTELDTYFSNDSTQVSQPGYNTWVPSIFFMKKMGDRNTIKLNYSKRIQRPDYWDLNPFVNTTDPKNISQGNPYLKPQISNRIELTYNYDMNTVGSFMVSIFYRTSKDDIQPYLVYYPSRTIGDTTFTNVSVSTRENIGLEKDAGVNVFANLHVTRQLDLRTNIFLFQRHTDNDLDPGLGANSFNYRFNMNLTYQFAKTLAGEFFGNFNSPRNELQGRYPSFTSYNLALRKQIWNKKGSIAITANNPFSNYINEKTVLFGPDFTINAQRRIPFRSFGLNFTWKFGKLEFSKPKEETPDVNGTEPANPS